MPPLTYIANPYSMHVAVWLDALQACGLEVTIETAEREGAGTPVEAPVQYLAPRQVPGPSILRYLWAGVAARLKRRLPEEILHAHCSSGNGMVAWMSGHPYIVTTYGSEVLAAADRGWLYQWLIRRVLNGAKRITATSPQMVEVLTEEYGIPPERIHLFDLGLDTTTFQPATEESQRQLRAEWNIGPNEPVWVAVKRAVAMNRTSEMVQAFLQYAETNSQGRLIVLCGNADAEYVALLKQHQENSPHGRRMIVVEDWLEASDVARWLQLADFALSVPTWDQMSNAVLEGMACGALPILSDIGGYRSLKERDAPVLWIDDCTIASLRDVFFETAKMSHDVRVRQQQAAVEFIRRHYADRRVWDVLQRLYNLPASVGDEARHAA